MSYQTRLRDHLDKDDNYAARVQAYLTEQRRQAAASASSRQPPQLEFLASTSSDAQQPQQVSSPSNAQDDYHEAHAAQLQAAGAAWNAPGEAPSAPVPMSGLAATPTAVEARPVNAIGFRPAVAVGSKSKFMPLEREALGRRLAILFEAARAKGQVSDANLLDRDPFAAAAQQNPLLNPPEPLWQELADEVSSAASCDASLSLTDP